MSDSKLHKADTTRPEAKVSKPPKAQGCCSMSCCCGCCCRCCRRSSGSGQEEGSPGRFGGGPDDAAHITAINSRQSETDPTAVSRKRKKKGGNGSASGNDVTGGPKHRLRCKKCCKSVTAFIFSHVGLCSLVVAYSIMGGFLFQWLESDSEVTERSNVRKVRSHHIEKLWNMTYYLNVLHRGNWSREANVIMQSFQDSIFTAVKEKGWDGRDEDTQARQWSFAGSLLYSITVITTIGYGHIAPKTDMGRLVTMFYALVGIPLTLLCLANIGSFFGNCFRFLYKHICGGLVWLCCPSHYSQRKPPPPPPQYTLDSKPPDGVVVVHGGVAVTYDDHARDNSKTRGKNGKMNKRAAAGDGGDDDYYNNGGMKTTKQFKAQNRAPSDEQDSLQQALRRRESSPPCDVEKGFYQPSGDVCAAAEERLVPPTTKVKVAKRKRTLKEEVRVPMLVSLMIIALYIFGGAVMFSVWEKDWNYLIGSYFCFITLSTIGFGDYVFGTGVEWNDNEKLIICAFYLAFGLSIIAMGFDLMQEEVRAKFSWLGTKLGIIDDDSTDDDDDDDDDNIKLVEST